MHFGLAILAATLVPCRALVQKGRHVHCLGDRAHVLDYHTVGEANDGSSLEGVETAIISMQPAPQHSNACLRASGDKARNKTFCYGVNQDPSCKHAKANISLSNGTLECENCFMAATANTFYKLNYTLNSLKEVAVGLREMHLRGGISVRSHKNDSAAVKGKKILSTPADTLTLINVLVGCPVCVRVKIEVGTPTTLNYDIGFKAKADVRVGADLDIHLGDRAIAWDHITGWSHPRPERTVTVKPILDLGAVEAEADVKLSVDTGVQLEIDNVISFNVNLRPSFPMKALFKGGAWPLPWKAELCLKGDAALSIGHEADLHWSLLSFKVNHHWGPYKDFEWARPGLIDICKKLYNRSNALPFDGFEFADRQNSLLTQSLLV